MQIKNMFRDDINRKINGVIQVEQDKTDVVEQEVKEYVVTNELKKHFTNFFNVYSEGFDVPTDNVGAWITGFFGSGKSHFLKMLSYLLENKELNGKKVVDYFEDKFDDELTFMNIRKSTQAPTEVILFNIDSEGPADKDATAVLKVFTKVFYNHLGFYGRDTKVAKLEQFISKQGKLDEFKQVFEEINGGTWEDSRQDYILWEDDIIPAMVQVLGISETAAQHWFDGTQDTNVSIEQLVDEIKEYVDSKGKEFRLLFMIDEAGQYMSTNTDLLLNLQTIIEKLGSVCRGQVWVVATGQEALDAMLKVRHDEFSRIMARFPIQITLTSSSAGEVIEKRLLTKTPEAKNILDQVYDNNDSVLRNLYAFDTDVKDIKGYSSQLEFERVYPFVPYQFIIMPKIFNEVRIHGHVGAHASKGERTMLSGFQQSAQSVEYDNELTIVPLYKFYSTLHGSLTDSVRSVIERAQKAADNGNGLIQDDVNLLELLYLVRYVDDIKSNIDNLTILMADKINVDKLMLKQKIRESLDRLQKNNYVARNGDIYTFLTNEEQDIEREINNIVIDSSAVISDVCKLIFDDNDLYPVKRYRSKKYDQDFDFDKSVDSQIHGISTGGMKLHFITIAADNRNDLKLIADSKGNEAICLLNNDSNYFGNIELSLKIKKYVSQKRVDQLPKSIQDIIQAKQNERTRLEKEAKEEIAKAIIHGKYYIDGEIVSLSGTNVRQVLDKALDYLVDHTYSHLSEIDTNYKSDKEVKDVLLGNTPAYFEGMEPNRKACETISSYLDMQEMMKMPVTMENIQSRYQAIPYGWKEIDIAGVVAQLIYDQKVTIKNSGQTIQPNDYRIIDFLRKKTERGNTKITKRVIISPAKIAKVNAFLREYFEVTNIPNDEDGLIQFIIKSFEANKAELIDMSNQSTSRAHPGMNEIRDAQKLVNDVLLAKTDNIALIDKVITLSDDLLDSKEDMSDVKDFYKNQITLYDNAVSCKHQVETEDRDFLFNILEVKVEIEKIADITRVVGRFNYRRIPELNDCISKINEIRSQKESEIKSEIEDLVSQCIHEIEDKAGNNPKLANELDNGKKVLNQRLDEAKKITKLTWLQVKANTIANEKDRIINKMDELLKDKPTTPVQPVKNKRVTKLQRQVVFNPAVLDSQEKIDQYLNTMKAKLYSYLNDCDEIEIK